MVKPSVSDEAVLSRTGRNWDQWFALLDQAGGREMSHREIVAFIGSHDKNVSHWWRQMITVSYEQAHGMREVHEKPGGFEISRSKTIAVPVDTLFNIWVDPEQRVEWLEEEITIRTATPLRTIRFNWSDGSTRLNVSFQTRGSGKSTVVVQHTHLPSADAAERQKAFWSKKLTLLKSCLEAR